MSIGYRCIAILLFLNYSPTVNAGEEPKPFEVLKAKVIQCLADPKLSTSPCDLVDKTLKDHQSVRKDGYIFTQAEMKIRRELEQLGLNLPRKIIPLTYKHVKRKSGDFIVIFDWSSGYEWSTSTEREDIDYLIFLGKIYPDDYFDSGYFNQFHIFTRVSPEKPFLLTGSHKVSAELMSEDSKDPSLRTSYWFANDIERYCINHPNQPENQIACISYFFSQQWPEVHAWADWRASTGIQISTFAFDGKLFNRLMNAQGIYAREKMMPKGSNSKVIFRVATTGEGYTDKWSYADPGQIRIWDDKSKTLEVSEELTKKYIPIIKRKLKGVPGEPTSTGFFYDSSGTIYEFVP